MTSIVFAQSTDSPQVVVIPPAEPQAVVISNDVQHNASLYSNATPVTVLEAATK